ncbi:MAG: MarR family winged helix-turn-helix transcriptional regulator [Geminicoccaceae bacterium]
MRALSSDLADGAVDCTGSGDGAETSKQRLRLWLKILKVSRRVESELREKLRSEFGSTLPRFDVMAALDRSEDGLRMSDLSGVLKVSNGNVTGIIDRLVADGLVERLAVKGDRRAMAVRLTGEGRDAFRGLASVHEGWVDGLFKSVDGEQAADLTRRLDAIAGMIDGDGVKAS